MRQHSSWREKRTRKLIDMTTIISRQRLLAYIEKEQIAFQFVDANLSTPSNKCQNHRLPQGYLALLWLFQSSQSVCIRRSNSDRSLHTSSPHLLAYGNGRISGRSSHCPRRLSNRDCLSSSDAQLNEQPVISASRFQGRKTVPVANGHNEISSGTHVPSVVSSCHQGGSRTCLTPYDTPKSTTHAQHQMCNASPQSLYWEST